MAVLGSACYERPTCSFRCGEGAACPYEYYCADDGWCKLKGTSQSHTCTGNVPAVDAGVDATEYDATP